MNRKFFASTFLAACLLLAGTSALAATDTVDWGQLGNSGTVLSTPQNFVSNGGIHGVVGLNDFGNFERLDEGNGWIGNFTVGEHLIWNMADQGFDPSIVAINTPTGVFGGGAQIQADFYGNFLAILNVYDLNLALITTIFEQGVSNGNEDGSAIFIGYQGNTADVGALQFEVVDINGNDNLAIGDLTLYTSGGSPVPEPGSLVLLGSGLVGLAGYGRRRLGL